MNGSVVDLLEAVLDQTKATVRAVGRSPKGPRRSLCTPFGASYRCSPGRSPGCGPESPSSAPPTGWWPATDGCLHATRDETAGARRRRPARKLSTAESEAQPGLWRVTRFDAARQLAERHGGTGDFFEFDGDPHQHPRPEPPTRAASPRPTHLAFTNELRATHPSCATQPKASCPTPESQCSHSRAPPRARRRGGPPWR